jgi:hypothetical protein
MDCIGFEVFTAMTMKNALYWEVTSCGSCKNRRFEGIYRLRHQGDKNQRARNNVSNNTLSADCVYYRSLSVSLIFAVRQRAFACWSHGQETP